MESVYSEFIIEEDLNNNNHSHVIVVNPLATQVIINNKVNRGIDQLGNDDEKDEDDHHDVNGEDGIPNYSFEDKSSRTRANETAVITAINNNNECLSSPNYQPISPVESPLGIAVASALDDSYFPVSEESIEVENKRPNDYYDDTSQSQQSPTDDPFRPECQIPLPGTIDQYPFMDNRTFVRRRNERERTRVRNVNEGFERLRQHLPLPKSCKDKRLSKVETLKEAINYIKHLQNLLKFDSNK